MEALARARPGTEQELNSLTKIPRFSKNKRRMYGRDIITALQQVQIRSDQITVHLFQPHRLIRCLTLRRVHVPLCSLVLVRRLLLYP